MASVRREVTIDVDPAAAWDALRDIGALHTRLCPGFVTNTVLEEGARVVTFGSGQTARELIVAVDDGERRVAWSVVGGPMTHHNASAQVFACGPDGRATRFVWIADFLPHDLANVLAPIIEKGLETVRRTLEAARAAEVQPHAPRPVGL